MSVSFRRRHGKLFTLVAALAITVSGCSVDGASGTSTESATDVTAIDLAETSFYLAPDHRPYYLFDDNVPFDLADRQAPELVEMTDGVYAPDGVEKPHMRFDDEIEPVYLDIDGDGDLDVATVLEWHDPSGDDYTSWKGVYVWLWEGGNAVPVEHIASWHWTCYGTPLYISASPQEQSDVYEVLSIHRLSRTSCGEEKEDLLENSAPINVAVENGVPVTINSSSDGEHGYGAVDRFRYPVDDWTQVDVPTDVEPRYAPSYDSSPIRNLDKVISISVLTGSTPDKSLYDGWIVAEILWDPEYLLNPTTTGWVNWNDVDE